MAPTFLVPRARPLSLGAAAQRSRVGFGAIALAAFVGLTPAQAESQRGVADSTAAHRDSVRVVARSMFGDAAVEVRARTGGAIEVGLADDARTIVLTFRSTDLRRWADSARRVLDYRASRRAAPRTLRALIEEPGVRGGSLSLSRSIVKGVSTYALFAADSDFERLRTTLEAGEARVFLGMIGRAVGKKRRASSVER